MDGLDWLWLILALPLDLSLLAGAGYANRNCITGYIRATVAPSPSNTSGIQ